MRYLFEAVSKSKQCRVWLNGLCAPAITTKARKVTPKDF